MASLVISSVTVSSASVNLTAQSFDYWAVLDNTASPPTPTDYKSGGAGTEITFAQSGAWNGYTPDPRTISWTDGHNTSSSSTVGSQLTTSGVGQYHTATFPADATTREYRFYAGIYSGTGKVTVTVSDSSTGAQTDTTSITGSGGGFSDVVVVVTGAAASSGQTITIKVESLTDLGSVIPYCQAAGYKITSGGAATFPPVPESPSFRSQVNTLLVMCEALCDSLSKSLQKVISRNSEWLIRRPSLPLWR